MKCYGQLRKKFFMMKLKFVQIYIYNKISKLEYLGKRNFKVIHKFRLLGHTNLQILLLLGDDNMSVIYKCLLF